MGIVLLQMLPLALIAITPTIIGMIVLLLSTTGGLAKALAFVLGKYITYILWGLAILALAGQISSPRPRGASTISVVIDVLVGVLLLVLAVRIYFGEDDPDAPPPKFITLLENMGPVKLFGVGIGLSLIQIRFIVLMFVGVAIITDAKLSTTDGIISLLVLALLMVWALLIPVVVFLLMGQRRATGMKAMKAWLTRNQRKIDVVLLGIFGIAILIRGLFSIF